MGRPSGLGLFASAVAFLLPLAYSPAIEASVWAPKAAVGLVIAGVGVPMLLRETSRAGAAAAAFLTIACISMLLADVPGMSFGGLWNWGTGFALSAAAVGAWSIGRRLNAVDRRLLEAALITAVLVVACLGILQSRVNLAAFGLESSFGRPTGLQGNAVYFGGIVLIGIALASWRATRGSLRWLVVLFVCAVAGAVGLGRVTLAVAVLIALFQIRANWRRALLVMAVLALGWIGGAGLVATSGLGNSPVDKFEGSTAAVTVQSYTVRQGFGPRVATWLSARHAIAEAPLLGAGPGRFWTATVDDRPLSVTRYSPNIYYADPHNFAVEYAVTTGALGVLALAVWLFLSALPARGPFAAAAFALGVVHLIQPQNAALTPLAMLCLGAAAPIGPPRTGARRKASRVLAIGGGVAAVALAAAFLMGQYAMRQAYLDFDDAAADRAYDLLPIWPEVADRRATVAAGDLAYGVDPNWDQARHYFQEATRRDPGDPRVWVKLGHFEQARGRLHAATDAYASALEVDPTSMSALESMWLIARHLGDEEMASHWRARIERITGS